MATQPQNLSREMILPAYKELRFGELQSVKEKSIAFIAEFRHTFNKRSFENKE
jgi:hypothetical protein